MTTTNTLTNSQSKAIAKFINIFGAVSNAQEFIFEERAFVTFERYGSGYQIAVGKRGKITIISAPAWFKADYAKSGYCGYSVNA